MVVSCQELMTSQTIVVGGGGFAQSDYQIKGGGGGETPERPASPNAWYIEMLPH